MFGRKEINLVNLLLLLLLWRILIYVPSFHGRLSFCLVYRATIMTKNQTNNFSSSIQYSLKGRFFFFFGKLKLVFFAGSF